MGYLHRKGGGAAEAFDDSSKQEAAAGLRPLFSPPRQAGHTTWQRGPPCLISGPGEAVSIKNTGANRAWRASRVVRSPGGNQESCRVVVPTYHLSSLVAAFDRAAAGATRAWAWTRTNPVAASEPILLDSISSIGALHHARVLGYVRTAQRALDFRAGCSKIQNPPNAPPPAPLVSPPRSTHTSQISGLGSPVRSRDFGGPPLASQMRLAGPDFHDGHRLCQADCFDRGPSA